MTRKPKSLASPPCGHIDATEPVGGSGKQGGNIAVTQQHRFYRKHHLLEQPLVGLFYRPDDRWSALAPVDQIRSVTGPLVARTAGNCGRWSMAFVVSESHGKTRTIRTMTRRLVDTKRHTAAEREREQRVCESVCLCVPQRHAKIESGNGRLTKGTRIAQIYNTNTVGPACWLGGRGGKQKQNAI